jgi:hypothetical protein
MAQCGEMQDRPAVPAQPVVEGGEQRRVNPASFAERVDGLREQEGFADST